MSNSIQLEDAEVLWNIDTDKKLKDITIIFKGVNIDKNSSGIILTINRELDEKVFKIATYISNKILLNTGIDALDPESVLYNSPSIFAENKEDNYIIEKIKSKTLLL